MIFVLVGLSLLCAVIGLFLLSNATAGVGAIALGCLFAILARVAQASEHQAEMMAPMRKAASPSSPGVNLNWVGYLMIGVVGVLVVIGVAEGIVDLFR